MHDLRPFCSVLLLPKIRSCPRSGEIYFVQGLQGIAAQVTDLTGAIWMVTVIAALLVGCGEPNKR